MAVFCHCPSTSIRHDASFSSSSCGRGAGRSGTAGAALRLPAVGSGAACKKATSSARTGAEVMHVIGRFPWSVATRAARVTASPTAPVAAAVAVAAVAAACAAEERTAARAADPASRSAAAEERAAAGNSEALQT